MRNDPKILKQLAESREHRMQPNGRPRFDLTPDEVAGSTKVAMRLAAASKSQVAERTGEHLAVGA